MSFLRFSQIHFDDTNLSCIQTRFLKSVPVMFRILMKWQYVFPKILVPGTVSTLLPSWKQLFMTSIYWVERMFMSYTRDVRFMSRRKKEWLWFSVLSEKVSWHWITCICLEDMMILLEVTWFLSCVLDLAYLVDLFFLYGKSLWFSEFHF